MYSKVIVPLDGSELSEKVLPYAQLVASSMSAPIELVEACHILAPAVLDTHTRHVVEMMLSGRQRRSEAYLAGVRDRLEGAGSPASVSTLRGVPADAILTHAATDPRALVVMSTHGRGGLAPWTLGSVTDRVLHSIPNPLLIVRAAATSLATPVQVETVLAPLDGSARAELSLPHVGAMAGALGAGISLLRVTPTTDYYREHLGELPPGSNGKALGISAEEQADADAKAVEEYLSDVRQRLDGEQGREVAIDHRQSLNVAQAIMDRASEQSSLVVMASHGLGGVGRSTVGSITGRVARHIAAPVLVIR